MESIQELALFPLSLSIPSAEHFAHELSVPQDTAGPIPAPGVQPFSGPSPRNFHTKKAHVSML